MIASHEPKKHWTNSRVYKINQAIPGFSTIRYRRHDRRLRILGEYPVKWPDKINWEIHAKIVAWVYID